ncbi:hypothetical protein K2Y11_12765 [bacterium]|nr:hypothetical protein [bacterium]
MTTTLKPYIRANLPVITGSERVWSDNEYKKLEATLNSILSYIKDLEARVVELESKG